MNGSTTLIRTTLGLIVWAALILPELASSEPPSVDAAPPSRGQFEAQWSVEGTQQKLDFDGVNSFSIFRHTGTVTVQRANGFVANALSKCIGLRDDQEGTVSRCVWVSANGDQIFSELRRNPQSPQSRSGTGEGLIVGGTGRFTGITGHYKLSWVDQWDSSPESIRGKTLSMRGEWKLPTPVAMNGN